MFIKSHGHKCYYINLDSIDAFYIESDFELDEDGDEKEIFILNVVVGGVNLYIRKFDNYADAERFVNENIVPHIEIIK